MLPALLGLMGGAGAGAATGGIAAGGMAGAGGVLPQAQTPVGVLQPDQVASWQRGQIQQEGMQGQGQGMPQQQPPAAWDKYMGYAPQGSVLQKWGMK